MGRLGAVCRDEDRSQFAQVSQAVCGATDRRQHHAQLVGRVAVQLVLWIGLGQEATRWSIAVGMSSISALLMPA